MAEFSHKNMYNWLLFSIVPSNEGELAPHCKNQNHLNMFSVHGGWSIAMDAQDKVI